MAASPSSVVALSQAECTTYLAGAATGFLATTDRALPVIVPVHITASGDRLLLAPLLGARLSGLSLVEPLPAVVALAIGQLEIAEDRRDAAQAPWSVVVQGILEPVPGGSFALKPELLSGWRRGALRITG